MPPIIIIQDAYIHQDPFLKLQDYYLRYHLVRVWQHKSLDFIHMELCNMIAQSQHLSGKLVLFLFRNKTQILFKIS